VWCCVSGDDNPETVDYEFQSNAVVNTVNGSLVFPFVPDDVDLVGNYYYNIQLTDGTGKISTIRKGQMVFLRIFRIGSWSKNNDSLTNYLKVHILFSFHRYFLDMKHRRNM